jgi:hypothetical protein
MSRILFGLLTAALLAGPGPARAADAKVYAGIEIGGKGVKATVVEARPGGLYKRLFAGTRNTTLSVLKDGAFDKDAINDAVSAISGFIETISAKYRLPPARIVVVGSSGLPRASNRDAFVRAVKKATGKDLRFIDDRTEVELTIAGVTPKGDRDRSISLDIGSGNTKGGYKPAGGDLVYVAIPLGTVTFTERVRKEAKAKGMKGMPELAVAPGATRPLAEGGEGDARAGEAKKGVPLGRHGVGDGDDGEADRGGPGLRPVHLGGRERLPRDGDQEARRPPGP